MNVSTHKINEGPLKARVQRLTARASDMETKEFAHATMNVEKNVARALSDRSEDAPGTAQAFGDAVVGRVRDLPQQLVNMVRAYPVVTLLVVVTVGFLVMRITRSQSA